MVVVSGHAHLRHMECSNDSGQGGAGRGRGFPHHGLDLHRSGASTLRGQRHTFIAVVQRKSNLYASGNGATSVVDFVAQRNPRKQLCAVVHFLDGKKHRLSKLELSEI